MSDQSKSPLLETEELLRDLLREVRKMKMDVSSLQLENERLQKELMSRATETASNLFANGSTEKMALRQQITSLIEKIDNHLTGDI
jgi:predicted  nucleic acid-binding Zn-ribbon protein